MEFLINLYEENKERVIEYFKYHSVVSEAVQFCLELVKEKGENELREFVYEICNNKGRT